MDNKKYERGETTAQAVLAVPVLLLFLLCSVQIAVFFHTAQLATIAAQEGAIAGAMVNGGEVQAIAQAVMSAAEQRATQAEIPRVHMSKGMIEVQVSLQVPVLLPIFPSRVTRSASEALERYVEEANR